MKLTTNNGKITDEEPQSPQEVEVHLPWQELTALQFKLIKRKSHLNELLENHDCKYDMFGTHGCQCAETVDEIVDINHRLQEIKHKLWR